MIYLSFEHCLSVQVCLPDERVWAGVLPACVRSALCGRQTCTSSLPGMPACREVSMLLWSGTRVPMLLWVGTRVGSQVYTALAYACAAHAGDHHTGFRAFPVSSPACFVLCLTGMPQRRLPPQLHFREGCVPQKPCMLAEQCSWILATDSQPVLQSLVCLQAPYNAVAMWSVPPQLRSLALSTQVGTALSPLGSLMLCTSIVPLSNPTLCTSSVPSLLVQFQQQHQNQHRHRHQHQHPGENCSQSHRRSYTLCTGTVPSSFGGIVPAPAPTPAPAPAPATRPPPACRLVKLSMLRLNPKAC